LNIKKKKKEKKNRKPGDTNEFLMLGNIFGRGGILTCSGTSLFSAFSSVSSSLVCQPLSCKDTSSVTFEKLLGKLYLIFLALKNQSLP